MNGLAVFLKVAKPAFAGGARKPIRTANKIRLQIDTSDQKVFDGTELTVMNVGHIFVHVEAVNGRACTVKKSGVKVIDRAFVNVGIATRLKTSPGIPK